MFNYKTGAPAGYIELP